MKRRDFITLIAGSTRVWPYSVCAQQPGLRVIGFLSISSPELYIDRLRAFRQGLQETGNVEGQNVAIEYRWAEGRSDRLPALADELVRRQVTVISAAGGTPSAMAAKAATTTIPIVFAVAIDPVRAGFVTSLNQAGGNMTGITNLNVELAPKRLELLRELLPKATSIAVLLNPDSPGIADPFLRALQPAARALGLQLHVLNARTDRDFEMVFTK